MSNETESVNRSAEAASPASDEQKARQRAQECSQEVEAVLSKHRCSIVPYLASEQIGPQNLPPTKALLQASYVILPEL